ncbi:diiron oxygenase [Mycolicibacterium porcinum]|uniref:Diiron oxygenase n=1 Tax=Mycolicibacterium porcinum TaxID=39693 RepID=A0ABV3VDQ4_9MYCO
MTAVSDADDTAPGALYFDRVEALSRATVRRRFDPHVDIDWDAPENALKDDDPRWQLDPESAPLAATDWYAEAHVPPLLNKITYIHLAEEARHISFADDLLAERMQRVTRLKRAWYAILFPFFLRWLIGEMIAPPRTFARQFGVPRQVFKSAFWRSAQSRQMMAESAADVRRVAEDLGLRTAWSRWIWRMLGIEGRLPRYRGEPDRSPMVARVAGLPVALAARLTGVAVMAAVALLATPDGVRIIAAAAAGAGVWAVYHVYRDRRGDVVGNQPFEWPRLFVWVAVCVAMIPAGGLIGLALVVFMILALAEFMPTI